MSLYLVGASNPETRRQILAHEDARALVGLGPEVKGFIDNDPAKKAFIGYPVLGGFEVVPGLVVNDREARFVNLITRTMKIRWEVSVALVEMGCKWGNLIHPSVDLTDVQVGHGLYIQDGVTVQARTRLGDEVVIHTGAIVCHECLVGTGAFLAPGVVLCGRVVVGTAAFVGANATVIPDVTIGRWATVGAGTVVIEDVEPYTTVVGNPAHVVPSSKVAL